MQHEYRSAGAGDEYRIKLYYRHQELDVTDDDVSPYKAEAKGPSCDTHIDTSESKCSCLRPDGSTQGYAWASFCDIESPTL